MEWEIGSVLVYYPIRYLVGKEHFKQIILLGQSYHERGAIM